MASPVLAILFFVSAMNLSGVPPLSGFLAKIGLIDAGIDVGTPLAWVVVVGGIATSLLTLYALSKVWSQAFWRPVAEAREVAALAAAAELAERPSVVPTAAGTVRARGGRPGVHRLRLDRLRLTVAVAVGVATALDTTVRTFVEPVPRSLPRMMLGATAAMTAVGLLITLVAGPLHAFTERAAADLEIRSTYVTSVLPEQVRR